MAYNVQVAVDAKHHLIVAHEVINQGHDRSALASIALAARKSMGKRKLQAIADRGYYSGEQIKACEDTGVAAILPKPNTSGARAKAASIAQTSSTSRKMTNTSVLQGGVRSTASPAKGGAANATLLEQRLQTMPNQIPVHAQRLPPHQPMGARRRRGTCAAAFRSNARRHDGEKADCGACVRHAQTLDGVTHF